MNAETAILLGGLAMAGAIGSRAYPCDLAISTGIDVSASVDQAEYESVRGGMIAALQDPDTRAALVGAWFHVYEWGERQEVVLPWFRVETVEDVDTVTNLIATHVRRPVGNGTATGAAMLYGAASIDATGCSDQRLNIITDGEASLSPIPIVVRNGLTSWRLQINAVAVSPLESAVTYLERNVIYGPGAFVDVAASWADFAEAFERKLNREMEVASR